MRVIKRLALEDFWKRWPHAESPLKQWYDRARRAAWRDFVDVRATFAQADQVIVRSRRPVAVFNIGGNKFRLIAAIHYDKDRVYVLRILTHREYDTNAWKEQL